MPNNIPVLKDVPVRLVIVAAAATAFVGLLLVSRFGGGPASMFDAPRTVATSGATGSTVEVSAGPPASSATTAALAATTPAVAASAPPTGHDGGDDGTGDGVPLVQPTTAPDAAEAATAFTAAWLNTANRSAATWRAGILDRVTDDLAAELADADPDTVPAAAKTGPVTLTKQGGLLGADAPIVTNEPDPQPVGTLKLTLLQRGGHWLISEIDWVPAR